MDLYGNTSTTLELSQRIPLAFFFAVVLILAVIGNGLVIGVIVRHRGMRTRTNMFLLNLAIADFLVGIVVVPFSLMTLIVGRWKFGHVLCQVNGFFNALLLMTSIHTLLYISIHKYLSISRPFSRFLTKRKIFMMIAATWLYPLIIATLTVTGLTAVKYKNGTAQCGPEYPHTTSSYVHHFIIQTTIIVIPLIFMAFAYIRMYIEIKKHTKRLRENSTLELDTIIAQQKKVTFTLFIVLACFMICWSPYMIYSQYVSFTETNKIIPLLNIPAYFFGMLNSACNPIIYALRSPPFRAGYMEILCRKQAVIMSDDTMIEPTHTLSMRVTNLWGMLKDHVKIMKPDQTGDGKMRGNSLTSIVGGGSHVVTSKSMTQLMKAAPRTRGNSVIHKDGSTVVMKDGKIVCVRQNETPGKRADDSHQKLSGSGFVSRGDGSIMMDDARQSDTPTERIEGAREGRRSLVLNPMEIMGLGDGIEVASNDAAENWTEGCDDNVFLCDVQEECHGQEECHVETGGGDGAEVSIL